MCYPSMPRLLVALWAAVSLVVGAASASAAPCDSLVDSADSLDFHQLHQDCVREEPAQDETAASTAKSPEEPHSAAANFQLAQGDHAARQQLLETLAATCPQGWHKLEEWTVAVQAGYRLYYRFQCR